MAEYVLTALDVTGIQRYIFNSNRLKENVGASELVYRATTRFVFEALPAQAHNVRDLETGTLDPDKTINDKEVQAEIVYAAGGNVLILFKDLEQAKKSVTALSKQLILEAPGLDLVAAHYQFDWAGTTIDKARQQVLNQLQQSKNRRVVSQPVLGLAVTVACQSTGLPAVTIHPDRDKQEENYPISAQVWAKIMHADKATDRFKDIIKSKEMLWNKILAKNYYFPMEFDDFGRSKNEHSYIAVVHADVNGMGARVQKVFDEGHRQGKDNQTCITEVRQFSDRVQAATRAALVKTIETLVLAIEDNKIAQTIPLTEKRHPKTESVIGYYLPFRPLVFGGDDLTFVCDGRLGLSLTVTYLNAFEAAINDPTITASAGISVVKTHYPFARAYELAEELCSEAKRYVKREAAAFDWHFAASGLLGDLEAIREKQYMVEDGKLYMRPIRLKPANGDWRTWDNVEQAITAFKKEQWADQHNKVLKLRRALRNGQAGVQQFLTAYDDSALPKMAHPAVNRVNETGWVGDRCGYFDSIEAMDFYVPLEPVEGAA